MIEKISVYKGRSVSVGDPVWFGCLSRGWETGEVEAIYTRDDGTVMIEIKRTTGDLSYKRLTQDEASREVWGDHPLLSEDFNDDFWRRMTVQYFDCYRPGFSRKQMLEVIGRLCILEAERLADE